MQISWFRPDPPDTDRLLDTTGSLLRALAPEIPITLVDRQSAHDLPWKWHRGRAGLVVYELSGLPGDAYMWPYLVRYPGLIVVTGQRLAAGHVTDLLRRGRRDDLDAETAVARGPGGLLAGILIPAARAVAVAEGLTAPQCPPGRPGLIHSLPLALDRPDVPRVPRAGPLRAGALRPAPRTRQVLTRATARARAAGAAVELRIVDEARDLVAESDVILSLEWPPERGIGGEVLAGLALGLPPVVFETPGMTGLPCLNPQTWQARDEGPGSPPPVAVSLDPRDEEHSLVLALRRLSGDGPLLEALAEAGRARWAARHAPAQAVGAFRNILEAAARAPVPSPPRGWPAHFTGDTSGGARAILDAVGLTVDILPPRQSAVSQG